MMCVQVSFYAYRCFFFNNQYSRFLCAWYFAISSANISSRNNVSSELQPKVVARPFQKAFSCKFDYSPEQHYWKRIQLLIILIIKLITNGTIQNLIWEFNKKVEGINIVVTHFLTTFLQIHRMNYGCLLTIIFSTTLKGHSIVLCFFQLYGKIRGGLQPSKPLLPAPMIDETY